MRLLMVQVVPLLVQPSLTLEVQVNLPLVKQAPFLTTVLLGITVLVA